VIPFYVSPEQVMQDKADYARKGIAKAWPTVAIEYSDGVLLLAENHSSTLHKICEIYDRIAFAGAGKFSEFESLRQAGIRHADLKGYAYDRQDVTAKALANAYSQAIGEIFSQQVKPLEVEILVAQVDDGQDSNELYRISFDGSIQDEKGFAAVGGDAEKVREFLGNRYHPFPALSEAIAIGVQAISASTGQSPGVGQLEGAVLDRSRPGRKFRFLGDQDISQALSAGG
jgi:proteasome alpha subunit